MYDGYPKPLLQSPGCYHFRWLSAFTQGRRSRANPVFSPVLATQMNIDPALYVRNTIRSVPDWPKPGVIFRDITPVLQDPQSFRVLVDMFVYRYMRQRLDLVAGIDARGFILGSVLAYELNLGFVPVRKKGKLPFRTLAEEYTLEYGNASVEMHTDSVRPGQRVLLIDDLIATGGTMVAASKLLQRLGANVVEAAAIIDLPDLGGSQAVKNEGLSVYTVCSFGETGATPD